MHRRAYTLLELIFVIVILGIVASIGASLIAQVYESYIIQRAQYRAAMKTELALNQIANRLRYAIPQTIVSRASVGSSGYTYLTGVTSPGDKVMQWVAFDGDGFEAFASDTDRKPGWSGFCDLDASGGVNVKTPGSNLDLAETVIVNLGGDIDNAVLYFPDVNTTMTQIMGYGISSVSGDTVTLDSTPSTFVERYKLAWTSYALEVDNNGDLILHYNFSPVIGAAIGGNSAVLLKDVTNFRFKGSEGSIRIKICKEEKIGADVCATVRACKEKVVF